MKVILYTLALLTCIVHLLHSQQLIERKSYYPDSTLAELYYFNPKTLLNDSIYKSWTEEGDLKSVIEFKEGKRHGKSLVFFTEDDNYLFGVSKDLIGKIHTEKNYVEDSLHGVSRFYYFSTGHKPTEEHILEFEQTYDNGKLIINKHFYEGGSKHYIIRRNGLCRYWYSNGNIKEAHNQQEGLIDGPYKAWAADGTLAVEGVYKQGKKEGKFTRYIALYELMILSYNKKLKGKVESEEYYKEGLLHGTSIYYNTNADKHVIEYDRFYQKDTLIEEIHYYTNGENKHFIRRNGDCKHYFINGEIKQKYQQENGIKQGMATYGYINDPKKQLAEDENIEYINEKGQRVTKGLYKNGKRVKKWKIYYDKNFTETQNFDSILYYRIINFDEHGSPEGKVVDYYLNGQKQWEGYLISTNPDKLKGENIFYYENGHVHWKGNYQDDKLHGKYIEYFPDGQIKQQGAYAKGELDEEWKVFDENGNLINTYLYDDGKLIEKDR